ncbi:hypothetical protein JTE90_027421 [Oedothorax gibbosus]|uniref:Uncharacterized protein n=1 Tax=Oedothorax gibbosus TaxID=931172 RepID=A0AAV6VZ93_9ARAC|nr:hypothetical protein JTE90_027421 [Oedothorax gibbosus]
MVKDQLRSSPSERTTTVGFIYHASAPRRLVAASSSTRVARSPNPSNDEIAHPSYFLPKCSLGESNAFLTSRMG